MRANKGGALPRRLGQVLDRLLGGDSEKQIARDLGISIHTVHVYVKRLYRLHDAHTRGELLAHYVRRPSAHKDRGTHDQFFAPGC